MEKLNRFKKIINKFYYQLFIENFKNKIQYNFPIDYFRWDLINYLINKNNYSNYLEIGCDDDVLFSKINIKNKIGVDPVSGGNIRKTSNDFFKTNKKNFDIVFIDGLHHYEQVKQDVINSINFLNKNGIILLHDCMPDSMSKQAVPRYKMQWNGDVWKAIIHFRQQKFIDTYTCEIDQGIGIIKKRENSSILNIDKSISQLKFKDYYENYKKFLRVIDLKEFHKIF